LWPPIFKPGALGRRAYGRGVTALKREILPGAGTMQFRIGDFNEKSVVLMAIADQALKYKRQILCLQYNRKNRTSV